MAGTIKQLLKSILNFAASLPSGLSPELLLPTEELCRNSRERSASMGSDKKPGASYNGFGRRPEDI
jgi:hypothetical protein